MVLSLLTNNSVKISQNYNEEPCKFQLRVFLYFDGEQKDFSILGN